MNKKIVILSHAYVFTPYREKILRLALDHPDLEVHLITPTFGIEGGGQRVEATQSANTPYQHHILSPIFGGKPNLYLLQGLRKLLLNIRPDLIIIEEEYWSQIVAQVIWLRNRNMPRVPIHILSCENICHDWRKEGTSLYQRIRYAMFDQLERYILPNVQSISFQFDEVWQDFQEHLMSRGFIGDHYTLPQLGVNQREVESIVEGSHDLREEHTIPLETFIFGYLGRITPEKGIEDMIRAFGTIPHPKNTLLYIVGNGDALYINQMQELCESLGIKDIVQWHSAVDFQTGLTLLAMFDCMILLSHTTPYWKEQFGRVLVEAMMVGTPILGSSSGSIPMVLHDTGYIVAEGDITQIRKTMIDIMLNPQQRDILAARALERVKAQYTYESITEQTYRIISDILTK